MRSLPASHHVIPRSRGCCAGLNCFLSSQQDEAPPVALFVIVDTMQKTRRLAPPPCAGRHANAPRPTNIISCGRTPKAPFSVEYYYLRAWLTSGTRVQPAAMGGALNDQVMGLGLEAKTVAALNFLVFTLHGAPRLSDRYFDLTGAAAFAAAVIAGHRARVARQDKERAGHTDHASLHARGNARAMLAYVGHTTLPARTHPEASHRPQRTPPTPLPPPLTNTHTHAHTCCPPTTTHRHAPNDLPFSSFLLPSFFLLLLLLLLLFFAGRRRCCCGAHGLGLSCSRGSSETGATSAWTLSKQRAGW